MKVGFSYLNFKVLAWDFSKMLKDVPRVNGNIQDLFGKYIKLKDVLQVFESLELIWSLRKDEGCIFISLK